MKFFKVLFCIIVLISLNNCNQHYYWYDSSLFDFNRYVIKDIEEHSDFFVIKGKYDLLSISRPRYNYILIYKRDLGNVKLKRAHTYKIIDHPFISCRSEAHRKIYYFSKGRPKGNPDVVIVNGPFNELYVADTINEIKARTQIIQLY